MYISMYVYLYICMYVYLYNCKFVYLYVRIFVNLYICISAYLNIFILSICICINREGWATTQQEYHLVAALSGANPLNLLMACPILPRGQGRGEGGNEETVALFWRRLLGDDIPVIS